MLNSKRMPFTCSFVSKKSDTGIKVSKKMKYVYIVYVKWTSKAMAGGREFFKNWLDAHEKVCKENSVKVLWSGIPYSTVEESAFFYKTDMPLHDFHLFKNEKMRFLQRYKQRLTKLIHIKNQSRS